MEALTRATSSQAKSQLRTCRFGAGFSSNATSGGSRVKTAHCLRQRDKHLMLSIPTFRTLLRKRDSLCHRRSRTKAITQSNKMRPRCSKKSSHLNHQNSDCSTDITIKIMEINTPILPENFSITLRLKHNQHQRNFSLLTLILWLDLVSLKTRPRYKMKLFD